MMLDQIYVILDSVWLDVVIFLACSAGAIHSYRRQKENDAEGKRYFLFFLLLIMARALQVYRGSWFLKRCFLPFRPFLLPY